MNPPTPDNSIRSAPLEFNRDGYRFKRVWRDGLVAIYSQTQQGADYPAVWEVILLHVAKPHPRDPDQSPKEHYPSSEQWGVRGWTCLSFARAKEKALGLT